jgi:hypothetical protein
MLARFERFMEQAIEGSLRRLFPTSVQPVQLAKAAARAMEEAQVVGISGPEVPNRYRLRLAAPDLALYANYGATLSRELARYLAEYARERGLRPVAEPWVELVEDSRLRRGSVRVEARFVDLAPERRTEVEAALDDTRRLRLAALAAQSADERRRQPAGLCLRDRFGLDFPLEASAGLVRIGRATDNDVVIAQQRVSRYHAQLRRVESNWLVYDLDSTNGTFVDRERVLPSQPRVVGPHMVLRLADYDLDVVAQARGIE